MSIKQITPDLYVIPLGPVNTFLIDDGDGLTLIDTGYDKSPEKIVEAVQSVGKSASDINHILVTHCHPDHAGGLARLKQLSGAPATMHPAEAAITRTGKVAPDLTPTPGLLNNILFRIFIGFKGVEYEAAEIEHEVEGGERLDIAGGVQVIHVPGHCTGQLAFLWEKHGGVLFAADTCSNMMGLGYSLGYADLEEGKRTLAKLADLDFEIACFGHGKTIEQGASAKFKKKWGGV